MTPSAGTGALRLPVVALAVLTVLAVAGLFVWDGGDPASQTGSGGGGGGGLSPSAAGDGPATGQGSSAGASVDGEPYVSVPEPPLDPTALAPAGATPAVPTELDGIIAWRVPGGWEQQLAAYQARFPVPAYELAEQRITSGGGGGAWDVVVKAEGYQPASGLLYIGPDPQDPASTIVEYAGR